MKILKAPYEIEVIFSEPIVGYWDGGRKSRGRFTTMTRTHPGPGKYIRWGCFHLNFWFTAGTGVSWPAAVQYAVSRLRAMVEPDTKISIIELEE